MGPDMRADYERDGFAVVTGALTPDEVAALRAQCGALGGDHAMAAIPPGTPPAAGATAMAAVAETVLGSTVEIFGATFLRKAARSGPPASWHQDGEPWAARLGGAAAVTVWVALDDVGRSNGCLRMIPGSHSLAPQPLRADEGEPTLFGGGIDPALVDESLAVDVPLAAGSLVAHHPAVIHGSGPNRSEGARLALAMRYRAC